MFPPNQPAAPNAGIASRLTIGHPPPGVGEPQPASAYGHPIQQAIGHDEPAEVRPYRFCLLLGYIVGADVCFAWTTTTVLDRSAGLDDLTFWR